ncbi:MAG TPA: PmoA family protein [Candidatus Paceibacterota bacterium]|nr:PmoA family protein [Verrucomicrobiota bacterium]HSA12075.1 PmoA family protein [Candidatus Paceibacterota bacterium]
MVKRRITRLATGITLLLLVPTACSASLNSSARKSTGVQITQLDDRLRVEINGQLFTEYYFKDVPRPYCYPLIGPGGLAMTRDWPMKSTPGEAQDHPHHRSLWFAHGAVNGHDFWSEQKAFGKTVHEAFLKVKSGNKAGVIRERNRWVAANGDVVCKDERTLRFHALKSSSERILDFEITLLASNGDLTLGDTKEGTMAVRIAETMRLKGNLAQGHIVNSAGVRDGDTWGKRADWCDYYGPVQGKTVGIAIFDHPKNPRHPTWWHVRDYGLFAANPFGRHDFEKLSNRTAGDLVVPAGKSVTFRYRFYLHEGDYQQADVAAKYKHYAK